jgi:hypothetical protein
VEIVYSTQECDTLDLDHPIIRFWCSRFATSLLINNNGELKAFLHLMRQIVW